MVRENRRHNNSQLYGRVSNHHEKTYIFALIIISISTLVNNLAFLILTVSCCSEHATDTLRVRISPLQSEASINSPRYLLMQHKQFLHNILFQWRSQSQTVDFGLTDPDLQYFVAWTRTWWLLIQTICFSLCSSYPQINTEFVIMNFSMLKIHWNPTNFPHHEKKLDQSYTTERLKQWIDFSYLIENWICTYIAPQCTCMYFHKKKSLKGNYAVQST